MGGFTIEVQRMREEYLGGGFEAKAFSWSMVVAVGDGLQSLMRKTRKVEFAG